MTGLDVTPSGCREYCPRVQYRGDRAGISLTSLLEIELAPQDLLHGLERIQKRPILDDPAVVKAKKMRGKRRIVRFVVRCVS